MEASDMLELMQVLSRLTRIEEKLDGLAGGRPAQSSYSTADVARLLEKSEFTVREWCRNRRVRATKRPCGRGNTQEWMISHAELERIRAEGLLPVEPR